ncbi:protein-tyrosine phosphatase-like protein [Chytriomyces cf. hyalinus JEL632]|nr:protein-tyrosine phosphatase-like protein [Chytriomyces cf. hyalinus JEL632]
MRSTHRSIDKVSEHVFISSFHEAEDLSLLTETGITHILSLGHNFTAKFHSHDIAYKLIAIEDDETENALDHFDDGVEFMAAAVSQNKNVLVHCMAGVSRSATFVAAYLMKSGGSSVDAQAAVDAIRVGRSCVCPNDGFMAQLEIYHKMNCKLEKNSAAYRRFRLALATTEQQQLGTLSKLIMTADPATQPSQTTSTNTTSNTPAFRTIRCKTCRRPLLTEDSVIPHEVGSGQNAFQYRKRDTAIQRLSQQPKETACSSYCSEPMEWMLDVADGQLEGKICCPNEKCGSKLGSFSWAGIACPCGTWVAPAFMIHKQKVDVVGGLAARG